MWLNNKTTGATISIFQHVQQWCVPPVLRKGSDRRQQRLSRSMSSSGPPWRLMFFGSDLFALESLKRLTASRSSSEKIVETLDVVTLSADVPVTKFAHENKLPVHRWPPDNVDGQFDVGVVVSFGCLLHERLINKFPFGILNVHPSLLPRWRGPAPIFHTILQGDTLTGVTIMQIRPHRFDVGPILNQELYQVPDNCTADDLRAALATKGAHLLIDTLRTLSKRMVHKKEQAEASATFAPKINVAMSWVVWEERTCDQIDRLYRAIGSRIPLRSTWMGKTIKLLDFAGKCDISLVDQNRKPVPGCVTYQKSSNTLAICCKMAEKQPPLLTIADISCQSFYTRRAPQDGWVGFKTVILKKRLTATDFYNGYLHQTLQKEKPCQAAEGRFVSRKCGAAPHQIRENSVL